MRRRRTLASIVCVLCSALCLLSVTRMAERVELFNALAQFKYYTFKPIADRTFKAYGRAVTIEDAPRERVSEAVQHEQDVAGGADWSLRLTYGDESVLVPVKRPPVEDAPELGIYDEWFTVVAYTRMRPANAEHEGDTASLVPVEPGEGERIVAMTRVPPAGYDPATWGSVKRADWTFRFYELKPDGTIEQTSRRWPRSDRSEKTLARTAAGQRGTPAEQAEARMLVEITPLDERALEYQLALNVMPKLNVPSYRFKNTAMEAMGWTLPTAFFSMLVAILSAAVVFAPKIKTA